MTDATAREIICRLGIGSDLKPTEIDALADVSAIDRFKKGETIFVEGQDHNRLYWVYDGRIILSMTSSGQSEKSLLTVGKGEILAWSSFVGGSRMTSTATAAVDTVLLAFDSDRLQKLCDRNREIGYHFMQHVAEALSHRLLATRLQLLDLFEQPLDTQTVE